MEDYDTNISERISAKDSYLSNQVQNVYHQNKLLITDKDSELLEELDRVISDSIIPDGPYYNTNGNIGKTSEAPTTVPGIHDKEVVPSDSYVNMELGFPRGSDDALMHALVKRINLKDYGKIIGTEHRDTLIDIRVC